MAIAKLGVSVYDFYEMTPVEFTYAINFVQRKEEADYKQTMEGIRLIVTHIWNSAGKTLSKNIDPTRLMPFDWDKPIIKPKQTPEEMKQIMMSSFFR